MIINSLTLHNFMSYADAQVDLTPVEIACLTGPNGAGKSALLDAITWALWESARASSDELVRLGQSEMWVDLCFTLEGQIYRIRRSRQKSFGRAGQQTGTRGNLDLQVWDGSEESWMAQLATSAGVSAVGKNALAESATAEISKNANPKPASTAKTRSKKSSAATIEQDETDDAAVMVGAPHGRPAKWKSLTCASMRETQKRLRELLRMDYETFITSVYLRQGRADEFTTRSANERKQVVSDILGLDYFDRLQELCREEARERKGRIQILEAGLDSRSDFEEGYTQLALNMEQLSTELQILEQELVDKQLRHSELDADIARLNYLQMRAETAVTRVDELKADLTSLERRSEELLHQKSRLETVLLQSDFIAQQFNQFEECKALAEKMDLMAVRHNELNSKRLELRSAVAMAQGRMEVEHEHLKATLDTRKSRATALEKTCAESKKLEESFQEYKHLLDAELEMSRKREAFTSLTARADELQSMIAESRVRLEAQIQQKEKLVIELDELLCGRHQIEQEQDDLQKQLELIDRFEAEFELVEEKGIKLKSQIDSLQQQIVQLKKYIRESEQKMHELCETPDLSSCPLCRSPIVDSKAVLDRYKDDCENAHSDIGNIDTEIGGLTEERDNLRKRYVELRKKISERKLIDMKIGEFNARKAAIERAEASRLQLQVELADARKKLETNLFAPVEKESLVRVKAELSKLEFDPIVFSSFQAQMRSQRHIEIRYQQLQKDLKELAELNAEIPALQGKIEKMEKDLKEGAFAPAERAGIAELETAIAELAYDKSRHQELKGKLLELMPYAEKARDLRKAEEELPEIKQASSELSSMVSSRRQEIERLQNEVREWEAKLDDMLQLKQELEENKLDQSTLYARKEEQLKQKMLLESRLEQLQQDKLDLDSKKKILADSIKEMSEYNVLAEAFGKKGLQAIIIENAIPEIEAEANRILSKLTDNQMHLALITQQRTRQGNPVETLDIIIADDIGSRSYELYSGGEAFKVNFALRVAMSRLLARRAGAKLETLIIDEGFGSQDEYSRAKMIQAISSIKSDFAKIIVVTHIAEVKEMFPVQIVVNKEEGISRVSLAS